MYRQLDELLRPRLAPVGDEPDAEPGFGSLPTTRFVSIDTCKPPAAQSGQSVSSGELVCVPGVGPACRRGRVTSVRWTCGRAAATAHRRPPRQTAANHHTGAVAALDTVRAGLARPAVRPPAPPWDVLPPPPPPRRIQQTARQTLATRRSARPPARGARRWVLSPHAGCDRSRGPGPRPRSPAAAAPPAARPPLPSRQGAATRGPQRQLRA